MTRISSSIQIKSNPNVIFRHLKDRYSDDRVVKEINRIKGYYPKIIIKEIIDGEFIELYACGRDSITKIRMSGWTWSYRLIKINANVTEVRIEYKCSTLLNILSAFTAKLQAIGIVHETMMGLVGLENGT